jgi:hypothetical protein
MALPTVSPAPETFLTMELAVYGGDGAEPSTIHHSLLIGESDAGAASIQEAE